MEKNDPEGPAGSGLSKEVIERLSVKLCHTRLGEMIGKTAIAQNLLGQFGLCDTAQRHAAQNREKC
jgi:hypothetical protein